MKKKVCKICCCEISAPFPGVQPDGSDTNAPLKPSDAQATSKLPNYPLTTKKIETIRDYLVPRIVFVFLSANVTSLIFQSQNLIFTKCIYESTLCVCE